MRHSTLQILRCLVCILLTNIFVVAQATTAKDSKPEVNPPDRFEVTLPLRELVENQPAILTDFRLGQPILHRTNQTEPDTAFSGISPNVVSATIGLNLLGVGEGFNGYTVPEGPSDTNLAVGDDQVVQWVSGAFAVFDKLTGVAIIGPIASNLLWKNFLGGCGDQQTEDPIVLFDKISHRWVLAQSTISGSQYYTCVAVSRSSDALSSYFAYSYKQPGLPDSAKWAVWTDAYYQGVNIFPGGVSFLGARICAYDRSALQSGSPGNQICFQLSPSDDSLVPADLDSPDVLPPSAQPEVFLGSIDGSTPGIYEYTLLPNFSIPTLSKMTGPSLVPGVMHYAMACGGLNACIPQQGVNELLVPISDRLMYRLAYRRYGANGSNIQQWLVNHAVDTGGTVGERWYEFRAPLATIGPPALSVNQQGTYSPADGQYRWSGSIASDKSGNILMGYSESSASQYPSIYFTGRPYNRRKGVLDDEAVLFGGSGSQVGFQDWGYYTSMAIDAQDGCTFWYTNQFYASTTGKSDWSTRVASLSFPICSRPDWPEFHFNRLHAGYNPQEAKLGSGVINLVVERWNAAVTGNIQSPPAVSNGLVYFGSSGNMFNDFYAYDAITGAFKWTGATNKTDSGPAVSNGMVYVGASDGSLYAFNASTGKSSWSQTTNGFSVSSPVVYSGMVYFSSDSLYVFDGTSGFSCWSAPGNSSPAIANGVIYVTSLNSLYAYKATACKCCSHPPLWTANLPGGAQFGDSAPAVADGVVYVGAHDGRLYAFDATTGSFLWNGQLSGSIDSSPAVANGMVFVGSDDGILYAYNAGGCGGSTTCQASWASAKTGGKIYSSPAVTNDLVFVGSADNNLYAYNANGCLPKTTCNPLNSWPTGGGIYSSPAISNGMVYVGSSDSKLHVFGVQPCSTSTTCYAK